MKMLKVLVLLLSFTLSVAMGATIKIGVLAPEGTSWAIALKAMAKEVKEATKGEVKFKIYFGGAQGDEPDVLRKIRVGQLHGGMFTGKTLGDINGDVRVMELPFTFFHDREKALKTLEKMAPTFDRGFTQEGFHNLGFFEIGAVYFVSKKKTENIAALKGVKIWSWEGDPLVSSMVDTMQLVSVPLALPDVLSSLQTGIIEAAYATSMAIIALQWNSKVNYLVDFPISFSVGAFLIGHTAWRELSANNKKIVSEVCSKYFNKINSTTHKENQDSLVALKSSGIEFVKFPDKDIKEGGKIRAKVVQKLKGKVFSESVYKQFQKEIGF